jgi:hypothetical protein
MEKTVRTGWQNRTEEQGRQKQDRQNRTGGTGHAEQECQNKT